MNMSANKVESGVQLLSRLVGGPDLKGWEPALFGPEGPEKSSLIEFYGEEGSGKGPTILHLIANALLPKKWCDMDIAGKETGVVLIDTDYNFCLLRLVLILENRINSIINATSSQGEIVTGNPTPGKPSEGAVDDLIKECISRLYVVRCNSTTQVIMFLYSLDSLMSNNSNIGILIIESISAFYWVDRSLSSTSDKNNPQGRLYVALKRVIDNYKICTIMVRATLFPPKNKEGGDDQSRQQTERWNYLGRQWQQANIMSYTFTAMGFSPDLQRKFCVSYISSEGQSVVKRLFHITDHGIQFIS